MDKFFNTIFDNFGKIWIAGAVIGLGFLGLICWLIVEAIGWLGRH